MYSSPLESRTTATVLPERSCNSCIDRLMPSMVVMEAMEAVSAETKKMEANIHSSASTLPACVLGEMSP